MKKLSRREIEQSVKSIAEPNLDSVRIKDTHILDHKPHRKARILGGNLTGIKKKKRSPSTFWWFGAVGLILLSGMVFIIPAFSDKAPKISQNKVKIAVDAIYEDSRIEETNEETQIESSDTFTLIEDRDRATEYREKDSQEKLLNTLKLQAQTAIENGSYTNPENGAYVYFQKILVIDQNNSFANKGINYLINRLHTLGMKQVEASNLRASRTHLASLFSIDSDSEKYIDLANAVSALEINKEAEIQQKEIDKILAKAQRAITKKRYTTPNNDNAFSYYQQILEIDENNTQANEGIQQVVDIYSERTNQFILERDWGNAEQTIKLLENPLNQTALTIDLEKKLALSKQTPAGQRTLTSIEAVTSQEPTNSDSQSNTDNIGTESIEPPKTAQTSSNSQQTTVQTLSNTGSQNNQTQSNNIEPELAPTKDRSIASAEVPEREVFQNGAPVRDTIQANSSNRLNSQVQQRQSEQAQLQAGLQAYYSSEYVTAFSNLAPLAERNNTRAQIRIGYMYQFGRGVEQNETVGSTYLQNALPSLKKLANQNQAWAQSDLGSLYEDGIVVTQSYTEALIWYRRAAAQNYTGAQTNLGNMYFFGKGVDQSETEAIRWYRLAAAGGDAIAKQNLIQLGALAL